MAALPSLKGSAAFLCGCVMWIKKFFKIGLLIKTIPNFVNG